MNTNLAETDSALAAAKWETIIKVGLDVHAAQITVCRQIDGSLPQPAQKMSWEKCVGWIEQQVHGGAKIYSCYEARQPDERRRVRPYSLPSGWITAKQAVPLRRVSGRIVAVDHRRQAREHVLEAG